MIKSILFKNLLLTTIKNKKRLRFVAEFSIFLIIAALISSAISIYFESRIYKYTNQLSIYEFEELKVQEWLKDSAEQNLDNRDNKFSYMLTSGTDILPISKARYYFRLLGWYPVTVDLALQDALLVGNDKLREKYEIKKKIKVNEGIYEYVRQTNQKIEDDDEFTNEKDIEFEENYFVSIDKKEIFNKLDQSERMMMEVGLYFQEYNNIIDDKKIQLYKKIEDDTKLSTKLILFAFMLQLIIFIIVQVFELRELRWEGAL